MKSSNESSKTSLLAKILNPEVQIGFMFMLSGALFVYAFQDPQLPTKLIQITLGVISAMMGLNLLNKYYVKAYTKGVGSLTLSSNSENSGENDVD